MNPSTIALIAGAVIVLLLAIVLMTRRGDEDQDKLTGNETSAAASEPEKRCASQATYDLIKRELFRRAAQVRGSDQAAFDKLAAYASIRMERPVLESEDKGKSSVSCSGALSLDLPPGVAVVGGRRTLSAEVDYGLQRAADGSGEVLTLSNADAIITPLATLARSSATTAPTTHEPLNTVDPTYDGPGEVVLPADRPPPVNPAPPANEPSTPADRATGSARPSFSCGSARTSSERAVCTNSGLAALDRQMASQFNRALSEAGPGERQMLLRTRTTFLNFRDRCGSEACIADAYRGRMSEIRDIMSGQWRPQR
ncbi:MAG: lysozyme inhibitor LprI family protein [Sphingomicrobium sp.]